MVEGEENRSRGNTLRMTGGARAPRAGKLFLEISLMPIVYLNALGFSMEVGRLRSRVVFPRALSNRIH